MRDIREKVEHLKKSISNVENKEYSNIFNDITLILEDMTEKIEETMVKQEYLEENVQYMDEDITELQDELFEEVSFDDLTEFEDEYIEIKCKNCDKPMFIEKESLDNNKSIPCPFCSSNAI